MIIKVSYNITIHDLRYDNSYKDTIETITYILHYSLYCYNCYH